MDNKNLPKTNQKGKDMLSTSGDYDGVLDVKGAKPFLVNMGGKPYMDKGGLSLKLQQIANKRGGIKSVLSIPISYAHESPEDMKPFLGLPPQLLEKIMAQRDYDMGAFTTPQGMALNKCIIIFGNGLKVSETATASKENVKMSTIHEFLDVMAATRAYNRCVKKITAQGFMDADMIDEEYNYQEDDFLNENESAPPFLDDDKEGVGENPGMGEEEERKQE